MLFYELFENRIEIPDKLIKAKTEYFKYREFNNEKEARNILFRNLEKDDEIPIGRNGTEKNKQIAKHMPLYKENGKIKIGDPNYLEKNNFNNESISLNDLEIKKTPYEEIIEVANANFFEFDINYRIKNYDIYHDLDIDINDDYFNIPDEKERVNKLAKKINQNKWFETIIVGKEEDEGPWIIEGQHRTRALILLGIQYVPAHTIIEH